MKWEWRVSFPDSDLSIKNQFLNSVEISLGSATPLDQLQPALATVRFLNRPFQRTVDMTGTTVQYFKAEDLLGQPVLISVDPDDDTVKRVFFGRVISYTQTPLSIDGEDVEVELNCQAYLDVFDQIPYGASGLPAQTEYERITASADLQRFPTWGDIPVSVTWEGLPDYWGDRQWQQLWWPDDSYRPILEVRNPSTDNSLDLEVYAGGETSLLQYVINQAMGCGSWISEFPAEGGAGRYYYHSRLRVLDATRQTVDISGAALTYTLTDTGSLWDIYTEVTVSNSTLTASDWNMTAAQTYGLRRMALQSPAANQSDLQTLATTKVSALSRPIPGLSSVTLDYNSLHRSDRLWTLVDPTLRRLSGIPEAFGGMDEYFVRGLNIRGSKEQVFVEWVLLNKKVLAPGPMWRNVSAAKTWSSLTTTWSDWNS